MGELNIFTCKTALVFGGSDGKGGGVVEKVEFLGKKIYKIIKSILLIYSDETPIELSLLRNLISIVGISNRGE